MRGECVKRKNCSFFGLHDVRFDDGTKSRDLAKLSLDRSTVEVIHFPFLSLVACINNPIQFDVTPLLVMRYI